MEIVPAIDLRGGKCVRLYQGDYGRETVYSDDPMVVASRWASQGPARLHVVDLDGARMGAPASLEAIGGIVSAATIPIQLGGGIRTVESAGSVMSLGVDRVVVGTAAVEGPALIRRLREELGPERLVVSVDARDGYVAVKGWTQTSRVLASDLFRQMAEMGVERFMYTDIARDGTLTEPNFPAIETLVNQAGPQLMAAGGISTLDHLLRLADIGVEAAIVGSALYTGDIDLGHALKAVAQHKK